MSEYWYSRWLFERALAAGLIKLRGDSCWGDRAVRAFRAAAVRLDCRHHHQHHRQRIGTFYGPVSLAPK